MLRKSAAFTSAMLMVWFGFRYVELTLADEHAPAFTTWIVFWVAVMISCVAYLRAGGRSVIDNISNSTDVVVLSGMVGFLLVYPSSRAAVTFTPFDVWCLVGSGTIIAVWCGAQYLGYSREKGSEDAHLLAQVLLVVAYFPTFQRLWEGPVRESFRAWSIVWVAATIGIYPAATGEGKRRLPVIYAVRASVMTLIVLLLILRAKFH